MLLWGRGLPRPLQLGHYENECSSREHRGHRGAILLGDVIPSADFMILRLTTVRENARSALEYGGLTPPSSPGLHALGTPRRRQAAALQGAFGTAIFMPARNLALA
jgi:hypothetical protein